MFEEVCLIFVAALTACVAAPADEVVYPRLLEARGADGAKLLYIRDGLTLTLEKSSVFAEHFVFSDYDGVIENDTAMGGKDLEQNLYHDTKHGSVIVVDNSNGNVQVKGILTDNLSIKPLSLSHRSEDGIVAHKISKHDETSNTVIDGSAQYLNISERQIKGCIPADGRRSFKPPEEFSVEVRLVVDRALQGKRSMSDLIEYFSIIMKKVNLIYSALIRPKIQMVVVGITRITSEKHTTILIPESRNETLIDLCSTLSGLTYDSGLTKQKSQDALLYVSGLPEGYMENDVVVQGGETACANNCHVCTMASISVQSIARRTDHAAAYVIARGLGHLLGMGHELYFECAFYPPGRVMAPPFVPVEKTTGEFSECVLQHMRQCLTCHDERCFKRTAGKRVI